MKKFGGLFAPKGKKSITIDIGSIDDGVGGGVLVYIGNMFRPESVYAVEEDINGMVAPSDEGKTIV